MPPADGGVRDQGARSDSVARTMRAMVLDEFGSDFRLEERAVPPVGRGEVLVKVVAVGAGVTNELARDGVLGGSVPRVHGHELTGTVAAIGPDVDGWQLGDRVTTSFYLVCGRCEWCTSGRENLCENFGGFVGIHIDGAFADYVVLPSANLIRIPEGVDMRAAGFIADAVVTPYHVVTKRLRMRAGQRVAVVGGGGGLGVHTLQVIRALGGVAIAVETNSTKAQEITQRGLADLVVVPDGPNWAAQVRAAAEDALAGVIDTVGSSETLSAGFQALGRAGTLVVLGHVPGAELRIEPERVLLEELVVAGTRYGTRAEIAQAMELVRLGRITPIVGATFPLEKLNDALARAHQADVFGRIVIDVADG